MKLNLELNCRVCLEQSDNMLSIFTQDGCQTIATKIADCAGIKIELNENKNIYPRNICPKCIAYLNIAYKFRSTCRNSEKLLHSLVLDLDEDISESANLLYKTENENLEPQNLFDESEVVIQIETETNINESEKKIENFDFENDDDDDDDEYLEIQALDSDSNGSNGNEIISHEMCSTTEQYNIKKVKSKILEIEEKQSLGNANFEICESYEDISQYYIEEQKLDEADANVENQLHNINFIRNYNQINTRKLINESEIESCLDVIDDEDYHQNKKKRDLSQKQKRKTYNKSIGKNKSKKNKIFQKEQNKSVILKNEMKPNEFVCEVCGNKYNKKALFDTHLRWHSEEKAYKCEVCGRAFTINFQLNRHMRIHTGDKPYTCSVCGRKFSDYSTCKKHKRTHTDERPFKCEICKKGFNYAHVLRVHMATHTGEKPYVCYQCDKKFSQPHHLKAHLATLLHKSSTGTSTAAATATTTMIAKHEFIEIESKIKIED